MFRFRSVGFLRFAFSGLVEQRLFERLFSSQRINGKNSTALVLGGFGFRERQMAKHAALYGQYNFNVVPVLLGTLVTLRHLI